jgi:hypothetical protein
MKVSEKSLELNIGAEVLSYFRYIVGFPKAYLRGLTQEEESQESADAFLKLPDDATVVAFQIKAPHGAVDELPYRFRINREQHASFLELTGEATKSSFVRLPFFRTPDKVSDGCSRSLAGHVVSKRPSCVIGRLRC